MLIAERNKGGFVRCVTRPIFVVGCCNSGTTILWQALCSHPDLSGPESEGQDITDLPACMRHFLGRQTFRMFAHPRFNDAYRVTDKDFRVDVARQVDRVYGRYCEPRKRFIEKSPANSMRTRFLQSIYEDASFVILVRNGYAVCEGIRRKRWFDPERPHMGSQPTTIRDAAEQWYHANRILLEDSRYLRRRMFVRYEDLVGEPAATIRSVLRVCGCEPSAVPVPNFDLDRNARQIARLLPVEIDAITEVAGPLLAELDYRAG